MLDVWNEYLSKGEAHHPLAVEDHNRVLFTSLKNHDLKAAEKAFERMRLKAEPDMVQEACRLLLAEFEKLQMEPKARHYRQLLRRSEEHTSELQSRPHLVCRLLLEKKKRTKRNTT